MPDIVIKPEDLEEMPKKTRELLLEYILPKMGLHETYAGWSTTEPKVAEPTRTLSDNTATQIPVEAAIAVLAPLGEQGIKAATILVETHHCVGDELVEGFSRAELAERLGISEKSVNGVIGSINRRYSFRFDKTKYDRKKCRVIRFNRKTARYEFVNENLAETFKCALSALNQVKKDGLSYEQYDYEKVFFETRYHDSLDGRSGVLRLNPLAIDEFMGENGVVHEFWEFFDNIYENVSVTVNLTCDALIGHQPSHICLYGEDREIEWFSVGLGDDGNLKSELVYGTDRNQQGVDGNE